MTDHLPECPIHTTPCEEDGGHTIPANYTFCSDCGTKCICNRLRQAEQRVWVEFLAKSQREDVYDRGYAAALTAARDKVTALLEATTDEQHALAYTNVLNTLREASDV